MATQEKYVIAFTDQFTECECCGKKELKGTYCVIINGDDYYMGSSCAFKTFGVTEDECKKAVSDFKAQKKRFEKMAIADEMVTGAIHSDYLKAKAVAYVRKNGLDIQGFIRKYGSLAANYPSFEVWTFGGQSFNFEKAISHN